MNIVMVDQAFIDCDVSAKEKTTFHLLGFTAKQWKVDVANFVVDRNCRPSLARALASMT